jgi:hypothetical protein
LSSSSSRQCCWITTSWCALSPLHHPRSTAERTPAHRSAKGYASVGSADRSMRHTANAARKMFAWCTLLVKNELTKHTNMRKRAHTHTHTHTHTPRARARRQVSRQTGRHGAHSLTRGTHTHTHTHTHSLSLSLSLSTYLSLSHTHTQTDRHTH